MTLRRVVVTGMGVLSPIGNSVPAFSDGLRCGTSGIRPITSFDTAYHRTTEGGEVLDFDPIHYGIVQSEQLDRCTQYALAVVREALESASLDLHIVDPFCVGLSLAILAGGVTSFDQYLRQQFKEEATDPMLALQSQARIASDVARELDIHGPNVTVATACAAGLNSVCYAFDCIRYGRAEVMVTGGSDPLTPSSYAGFNALQAMSKTVCRPYDRDRDGIAMGGAAAALILENLESASRRGAPILAEIRGYGLSNDAYHQTAPHPEGLGAILAMRRALADAKLGPESIDYIGGHGTATPHNDEAELVAVHEVFGERAARIPISSIKSMIGHTLGASGSLTILSCVLAIQHNFLPPTINFQYPIPGFETWDFVPNHAREAEVHVTMANAFAFGGHTASMIITRFSQS